jgi:23S rRNA (guanosine2251-2'-O)-methyltransferase
VADRALLEGHVSVEAALRGRSRPIHRILVAEEGVRAGAAARRIVTMADRQGVPVQRVARTAIETLARGRSHGGLVAEVGERSLVALDSLVTDEAFVVMLDGVEDPYNLGAALRSLYAAGASGLVIRERSWDSATTIIARSSAGASELLPVSAVADPLDALQALGRAGLRTVVAAERADAVSLYEEQLTPSLFVLLGGERRGVARSVLDQADAVVRIPYSRPHAASLGTAAAAAVIGFEVQRQRLRR